MRGRHAAVMIHINQQTRATLQGWLLRQKTPVGRAKRARGMLLLAARPQLCSYCQMGWLDRV